MITKNDCLSMLVKIEDTGVDIKDTMKSLLIAKDVPIEVLKFIHENRGIEANNFYEMLRKRYNEKKSILYKNILNEVDNITEALITLSSFQTQIMLYSKKIEDKQLFFKEIRLTELLKVLNDYFETFDETKVFALLKAIKIDLMVLEYVSGRRELS